VWENEKDEEASSPRDTIFGEHNIVKRNEQTAMPEGENETNGHKKRERERSA
jgi:hypothetical protein